MKKRHFIMMVSLVCMMASPPIGRAFAVTSSSVPKKPVLNEERHLSYM